MPAVGLQPGGDVTVEGRHGRRVIQSRGNQANLGLSTASPSYDVHNLLQMTYLLLCSSVKWVY